MMFAIATALPAPSHDETITGDIEPNNDNFNPSDDQANHHAANRMILALVRLLGGLKG